MVYIGYFQSIESSGILFSEDYSFLKGQWCFGMAIFEADGLTQEGLKQIFPETQERGVILNWLRANKKEIYSQGWLQQK